MDYQAFQKTIKEQIKGYLPEEYQEANVNIRAVEKNNAAMREGLTIQFPNENMCPTIYLNSYFQEFEAGKSIEDIMGEIASIREIHGVKEPISVEDLFDFERVKENIVFQVVGAEKNQGRLSHMPHRKEADMALVYRILTENQEQGIASIEIGNELMKELGVEESTLYTVALENTQREFPLTIQPMDDAIREMMQGEQNSTRTTLEDIQKDDMGVYVLSNATKQNGAASLFYPEVQEQLAQKLGGDYFVLPSSIHEMLIMKDDGARSYQELKQTVQEVNETQVAPEEVLTGEVYSYDKSNQKLMIAEERFRKPSIMEKMESFKAQGKQQGQGMQAPEKQSSEQKGKTVDVSL